MGGYMNAYICLPNDGEFEFEVDLSFQAGDPGNLNGLPENCWPSTPDEAEIIGYGPFNCMYDAVYTACWMFNCPMSEAEMLQLSEKVESETVEKFLAEPVEYEPDYDDRDDDYER
jgi:hypothetical protein